MAKFSLAGLNEPKYTKKEVSQKFNLKKLLGYEPNERQKELFYNLVVDRIVERTAGGKSIDNRNFARYSENYAKKKGVSRDSVDLILEGDMLSSINPETQKNVIKIKMQEGVETLKAYNHNVGDTLPKRTFFGVTDKEVKSIIKDVDSLADQKAKDQKESIVLNLAEIRAALNELDITFEGFDGEN